MSSRLGRALSGALFYSVATLLERAVLLVLMPFITRVVTTTEFAAFAILRIGIQIVNLVCDSGTGIGTVRLVAERTSGTERDRVTATLLSARFAIGVLAVLLTWYGLRYFRPGFLASSDVDSIALVTAIALGFTNVADAAASAVRAEERHTMVAVSWIARGVFSGIGYGLFVLWRKQGLMGLMFGLTLGEIAALIVLLPAFGALTRRGARPALGILKELLVFGVPAALSLLSPVFGALDRYAVQRLASTEAAAFYHLANGPAFAVDLVKRAGLAAFEPYVFGVKTEDAPRELERLSRAYSWLLLCVALGLSVFAPEIVAILAPPEYHPAIVAVPALSFSAVFQAVFRMVALGSGLAKKTRVWAIAGFLDLGLTFVLLFSLVPAFGVLGAGLARFASALVGLVACGALTTPIFAARLPANTASLLGVIGLAVSMWAVGSFGNPPWALGPRCLALLGVALVMAVALHPPWQRRKR